jgi:hypothetical protein
MGMSREYYIAETKARFDIEDMRSIVKEGIVNEFLDGGFDDKGRITKYNIGEYADDISHHMSDDEVVEYILDNDLLEIMVSGFTY